MNHAEKHRYLDGMARSLAPSLRDKFDFSDDGQFAKWADLSFKAAQAFIDKSEPLFAAAVELDAKEFAARQAAAIAEAAKAKAAESPTVAPFPLTEVGQQIVDKIKAEGEGT